MKKVLLFIAFFGILLANAQETESSFDNEQESAVDYQEQATEPEQAAEPEQPMQAEAAVVPASQAEFDSTEYYMGMIQQYTESGNSIRRVGKFMMLGGGIGAAIGIGLLAYGSDETCETDYFGKKECTARSESMCAGGAAVLIGGAFVFGIGTIVKFVGSGKLRKAIRYEDRFQKYKMRHDYSMKLRFDPILDIVNKNVGANVALEF